MTAELLALLDSDPAAGILAVADLREQRAKAATQGPWRWADPGYGFGKVKLALLSPTGPVVLAAQSDVWPSKYDAEHIAAEANPAHALAAVRRWRGVVERHRMDTDEYCAMCITRAWPCPDLRETAVEARAYLGGAL